MFPTYAIYPFTVSYQPLKSIIFFHQIIVGLQASASMAIDAKIAFLLRYVTARFEILGNEIRNAKSMYKFNTCMKKYNELLRYSKEIRLCTKFLVVATMGTTITAMIFGGLNFVTNQPLVQKVLYATVVFSASVELFIYTWPADSLMSMSFEIAAAVYDTDWYRRDVKQQRMMLHVILRSQKYEVVQIRGLVRELSLPHYMKYLYTSLTYFNALRVLMQTS
ncbi:PREDICTED: odorant receptor 22c-like [Eufriesea mexicana]|uniref:odorant receptor 22c-like n=1 Tax=Eufriesea mexicana TaxID=516756 RepID=UPI00083C7E21|nr:PREDICTED: odorant receptor 22c-like [Eufriesea mexicana]